MEPRLQRRVQRYGWDKAMPHYEQFWARQLAPSQQRLLDMAAIAPGERVLDVACGTGLVTFPAARAAGPQGSVLGVDISDEMIACLLDAARTQGLAHVSGRRMDAESLECPDAAFDVALCSLGLMYLPDPLQALREMHRVLAPGGRVCASVWGARRNCGWAEVFPIVDGRVQSEVCPMFFQLGTGDALADLMRAAGFAEPAVSRLGVTLEYDSDEDACGAAFVGGPVALAYSRFDETTRREAHAEYLASIAAYRRGAGYAVPGEFVIACARRP